MTTEVLESEAPPAVAAATGVLKSEALLAAEAAKVDVLSDANEDSDSVSGSETTPPESIYDVRERWEGVVEDVCQNYFVASVVNMLTDESATVEIFTEDVNPMDRDLIALGNMFYWHVGYRNYRSGNYERVMGIRFRRGHLTKPPVAESRYRDFWLSSD